MKDTLPVSLVEGPPCSYIAPMELPSLCVARSNERGDNPDEIRDHQQGGVRIDTDKEIRRSKGVRSDVVLKPGLAPDTAHISSPAVHLDTGLKRGGSTAGVAAPVPGRQPWNGGGHHADLVLPLTLDAIDRLAIPTRSGTTTSPPLCVHLLAWPPGLHARAAHDLVSRWRRFSRRVCAAAHNELHLVVPLDARCFETPGIFGCPARIGEHGDDHWVVQAGPEPDARGFALVRLVRRSGTEDDRHRIAIRAGGSHIFVSARKFRGGG
jgi:hypothetical protein